MDKVDVLRVSGKQAVVYMEFTNKKIYCPDNNMGWSNLEKKYTSNKITNKNRKRMKQILENWCMCLDIANIVYSRNLITHSKALCFVTLTLPATQVHDDRDIKRQCLTEMIKVMIKQFKVINYVWVAEKQKNGNIHFHLIIDKSISHTELRKHWNRLLNNMGYIDRYRFNQKEFHKEGFKVRTNLLKNWDIPQQKKAYFDGINSNWSNPNTTDVKKLDNVKNLYSYMMKYLSKGSDECPINGHKWGASASLKHLKYYTSLMDNQTSLFTNTLFTNINSKILIKDYFSVVWNDSLMKIAMDNEDLWDSISDFYIQQYHSIYG
jgi:hypothetical protein